MSVRMLLAALLAFLPAVAAADDIPRTIHASGEAMVCVAPDEVNLRVGIETFAADLAGAKAMNDDASRRMRKAVLAVEGIDEKHVQAAHMEIEICYHSGGPKAGIAGYLARRAYSITLRDPKRFEKLVDAALSNGANRIFGYEFRTTELRKHRDEARRLAIRAARDKAVALAAELGCKVGAPRSISEGYASLFGAVFDWNGRGGLGMSQNAVQVGAAGDSGGETLPLGQIGVRATISVTFDLIPG